MALVTEDGTGLADAESYESVAGATTYFTWVGKDAEWAAITNQEAALRKATNYMLGRYLDKWDGYPTHTTQRLDWPRVGVTTRARASLASNYTPGEVRAACAELALRSDSGPLLADSSQAVKREKVGPLEVEYDQYSSTSDPYQEIDAMLAVYLKSGARSSMNVAMQRT